MKDSPVRAAVLIPLYKKLIAASEIFSFKNTLSVLSKHDIYVIGPKHLRKYFSELKIESDGKYEVIYFPDRFFADINGYNSLLMTLDFYTRFDCYEYVLIAQTDVLVLADRLEQWCDRNYSFVGAPWFRGMTRPRRPLSLIGVGNGGFSLRKVADCLMVLSTPAFNPPVNGKVFLSYYEIFRLFRFIKHTLVFSFNLPPVRLNVNEDIFWGVVAPDRCDSFTVPNPAEAISFAFEAAPEYLFELNNHQLPFGCHAWERYNPQFWRDILSSIGMRLP